jgi:uncharacterized protein YjiS (DUF1127 family)
MNATQIFDSACIGSSSAMSAATPLRQRRLQHLAAAIGWVAWQLEKRRGRRALLELTDDQLKDIGLSRGEVHGISARRAVD